MQSYHVNSGGRSLGQLPESDIRALLSRGELSPGDLCWAEGMAEWKPLASVLPGLAVAAPANPYAAPTAMAFDAAEGEVAASTVDLMRRTRPWTMFFAILLAIGSGFMVLGGLAMLAMGGIAGASTKGGAAPAGFMVGMAVLYILFALLYIMPMLALFRYSSAVTTLVQSRAVSALNAALEHQRKFWKLTGVMTIVFIAIYIVAIIVIGVSGGIAAAAASKGL